MFVMCSESNGLVNSSFLMVEWDRIIVVMKLYFLFTIRLDESKIIIVNCVAVKLLFVSLFSAIDLATAHLK